MYWGHTPSDLSDKAKEVLKPGEIRVRDDYSASDRSQQGEAVALERLEMLRVSIPHSLIDLHRSIKTNIRSQFGPLTCTRLTGESGTYDDNTDYNVVIIYSEHIVTNEAVFVST